MTRTQRRAMLSNVISTRITQAAYKAWYVYAGCFPTERGTVFKVLNK